MSFFIRSEFLHGICLHLWQCYFCVTMIPKTYVFRTLARKNSAPIFVQVKTVCKLLRADRVEGENSKSKSVPLGREKSLRLSMFTAGRAKRAINTNNEFTGSKYLYQQIYGPTARHVCNISFRAESGNWYQERSPPKCQRHLRLSAFLRAGLVSALCLWRLLSNVRSQPVGKVYCWPTDLHTRPAPICQMQVDHDGPVLATRTAHVCVCVGLLCPLLPPPPPSHPPADGLSMYIDIFMRYHMPRVVRLSMAICRPFAEPGAPFIGI